MIKLGLTGGLATGKSTVLKMFGALGEVIINADRLCSEIAQPYQVGWWGIYQHFGRKYLAPDMTIKRAQLKRLIFSDQKARLALNQIMHPPVREIILKDLRKLEDSKIADLVVVDVPLLFEVDWRDLFDKTLVVYARPEVQIDRLVKREGISPPEARGWLDAQMPIDEKKRLANYVIDNSGSLEKTREQVLGMVRILMDEYSSQ